MHTNRWLFWETVDLARPLSSPILFSMMSSRSDLAFFTLLEDYSSLAPRDIPPSMIGSGAKRKIRAKPIHGQH